MKNLCRNRDGYYIKIPTYWHELLCKEPDERIGKLFKCVMRYAFDDIEPEFDLECEKAIWFIMKRDIDYQCEHHRAYRYVKRPENQVGRFTREYSDWRNAVYERDGFICQRCGQYGGKLNAHHIKPYAYYPELRLDINNGITLCKECHRYIHRRR